MADRDVDSMEDRNADLPEDEREAADLPEEARETADQPSGKARPDSAPEPDEALDLDEDAVAEADADDALDADEEADEALDADEDAVAETDVVAAEPADTSETINADPQDDSTDLDASSDLPEPGDKEAVPQAGATEPTEESSAEPEATAEPSAEPEASHPEGPAEREECDADADTETLEAPDGMGEPEVTTERVVEAVLFASDAPVPLSKIVSVLGVGSARDVRNHIKALNEKYERTGASFRIEQIASGYQMLTLPVYNAWIRRLKQSKQDSRLSQPAMETLAVVAYKQPVVRADIEAIRGVSAGEMLNRLRELGLIKIVGRAEDVGRPMLYGTTKRFLEVFGLSGLEDLPAVEEMQPGQQ